MALLGIGAAAVGISGVLLPFVSIPLMRSLPYMHTPRERLVPALRVLEEMIRERAGARRKLKFVDLGSGDGTAVVEAASSGFASAEGVELNWTLNALARAGALRRGVWGRTRFHGTDLWDYDLGDCDGVMMFGVRPLMKPLAEKVRRECRDGAVLMLYRFSLPAELEWPPERRIGELEMTYYRVRKAGDGGGKEGAPGGAEEGTL